MLRNSRLLTVLFLLFISLPVSSSSPTEEIISSDVNGFLDESVDYSRFSGRVSDKSESGSVLKIKVENNNIKFFRAGDKVTFTVGEDGRGTCNGSVKGVEDFHFTIYVSNIKKCTDNEYYFRRGAFVKFHSPVLQQRIGQSSNYRKLLLLKKDDFLKQLSKINHFLWSFDQERVKVAAQFDNRILDIQREKQRAMDNLLIRKQEESLLQLSLQQKLDELDNNLQHYTVERQELLFDRWSMDQDLGLPVGNTPQQLINLDKGEKRVLNDQLR